MAPARAPVAAKIIAARRGSQGRPAPAATAGPSLPSVRGGAAAVAIPRTLRPGCGLLRLRLAMTGEDSGTTARPGGRALAAAFRHCEEPKATRQSTGPCARAMDCFACGSQ